jgi:hypothetical protein
LKKIEYIETVKDKLGEMNVSRAKRLFHPQIIEIAFDYNYADFVKAAFKYNPGSINGCHDIVYNRKVFYENTSNTLFCLNPKVTIPVSPIFGGVVGVKKVGSSSTKFEPASHFINNNWDYMDANFSSIIRYREENEVDFTTLSTSATGLDNFVSLVWFDSPSDSQLQAGDKVNLTVVPTFSSYSGQQQIFVPNLPNTNGQSTLINIVYQEMLRKLGIQQEETQQINPNKDKE